MRALTELEGLHTASMLPANPHVDAVNDVAGLELFVENAAPDGCIVEMHYCQLFWAFVRWILLVKAKKMLTSGAGQAVQETRDLKEIPQ